LAPCDPKAGSSWRRPVSQLDGTRASESSSSRRGRGSLDAGAHYLAEQGAPGTFFGLTLPGVLRDLGLETVGAEASTTMFCGGDPYAPMWRLAWPAVGQLLLDGNACTQAELDILLEALEDPTYLGSGVRMVAARGQSGPRTP